MLRLVGIVIRDETGDLYDGEGKALKCNICEKKLSIENIGFMRKDMFTCDEFGCLMIVAIEEMGEDTKIYELNLDELKEIPEKDK